MRHLLVVATMVVGALLFSGVATEARAQCTTGCSSPSSCNGTGKAGCVATCDGTGKCECGEDKCGTQLRPSVLLEGTGAHLVSERGENRAIYAALLVDCHGNTLDVWFTGRQGQPVFTDLPSIVIQAADPAPPARIASRE
jgi:hypothetical protein